MKYFSIYQPAADSVNDVPRPAGSEDMRQYATRMFEAGILLSQAMFGGPSVEISLDGGKFSVTQNPEITEGYAILEFSSREAAIDGVKEFLEIGGGGRALIRQVVDRP